nr:hypothetical protein BHI3_11120 [Bacteriovorax sp. HI3]
MKTVLVTIFCSLFTFMPPALAIPPESQTFDARHYETFEIKTKIEAYEYEAIVYKPKDIPIKAMLVIYPTIGGVNSIEGSNAQYFSKRGYVVIVPYLFETELNKPNPDMDKLDSDYYRPVVSVISFINYVDFKLNLPSTLPVFALGASQGGITSILITAYVPRIKAAWFAVAGGDLPYIYAHSTVLQIRDFRERHMRTLGMSDVNQYETYLRGYLKNDPSLSCKDIKVPFHQVIALKDTGVPTVTQELLARECPSHTIDRYKLGHEAGTLTTVLMRKKIFEYFESFI